MDIKKITDNREFWNTVKPILSDKGGGQGSINLQEDGETVINDDKEVVEVLNNFFVDSVRDLQMSDNFESPELFDELDDHVNRAVRKYQEHPSIAKIRQHVKNKSFSFSGVTLKEIEKQFQLLNPKKATTYQNIPAKILKESFDSCGETLLGIVNNAIDTCEFPDELKLADITPLHKKGDKNNKKNYRPVSILPTVSKMFERILQEQLAPFFSHILSPYLCGYRKGFNTQHALLSLIEKWKMSLDRGGYAAGILMDLSKAFDTVNHELLLAKLCAYGLDHNSLKLISSYLTNRWQRTKINTSFSPWIALLLGVPQGSVLGPLLFNIYINDMFLFVEHSDVCNYADDTTLHASGKDMNDILGRLEQDADQIATWFQENCMKLNKDKCHLLVSGRKYEHVFMNFGSEKIWECKRVRLLGLQLDSELKFDNHIQEICKKAGRKLNAIARISRYMTRDKVRTLIKAFFESQFLYCRLSWMFMSRKTNNRINALHERALRIVYSDFSSSYQELLQKDGSTCVHYRNIQRLALEMYKRKNHVSPAFMSQIFVDNDRSYNLRGQQDFCNHSARTVTYGTESIRVLGPKIWNLIPHEIRECNSLEVFSKWIKNWIPESCPCRLCKNFVDGVGFL